MTQAQLQAAIDAAFAGTGPFKIAVPDGRIVLTSSLYLKSNADHPVTLYGEGPNSELYDGVGNMSMLQLADAEFFTVHNLGFVGQGTLGVAGRAAIKGDAGSSFNARDGMISNCWVRDVGTCGIGFHGAHRVHVVGCYIQGTKEHGVYLSECVDCIVCDTTILESGSIGSGGQCGIKIADCGRCLAAANVIILPEHEGILFEGAGSKNDCWDCIAAGNVVRDCPQRNVRFNAGSRRNSALANLLVNPTTQSIRLLGGQFNSILGNVIDRGASADTMVLVDVAAEDARIARNTVISSSAITNNGVRTILSDNRTSAGGSAGDQAEVDGAMQAVVAAIRPVRDAASQLITPTWQAHVAARRLYSQLATGSATADADTAAAIASLVARWRSVGLVL